MGHNIEFSAIVNNSIESGIVPSMAMWQLASLYYNGFNTTAAES